MKIKEVISKNKRGTNDFYIYAETAFIHEGSIDYLMKLIDAAKHAKCNGIKFQILLDIDNAYKKNAGVYHTLKSWRFSKNKWSDIIGHAKDRNLEVIALPVDFEALRFCLDSTRYIDCVEVHPICFNDYLFLKELDGIKGTPVILGVSGSTLDEIDYALGFLKSCQHLLLMYGFQSYPTNTKDINLSRLRRYRELFDLPVGYADHTKFDDPYQYNLMEYAYVMGARIFERHITLTKGKKRTDYVAAVDYKDILELRVRLNRLITVLGEDSKFSLNKAEAGYRNRRKQLVYAKDIERGEKITRTCIAYKVCLETSDFDQKDVHSIIGRKAVRNLKKDCVMKFQDIAQIDSA